MIQLSLRIASFTAKYLPPEVVIKKDIESLKLARAKNFLIAAL